ncbi:hypothetical protein GEMRC1_007204 [Eukaryota sp. GEM-RC1]
MNPDVTFDSLSIENTGVVSLITNYTINLRFLRLVGGYRGGTDLLYVRERLIWNQGGFIDPSLTIAERGCNIDSWDLKEVLDYASVIFEDDVHWIRDSEIRGGRNASLIFNKDLKVYEGGLFTLSPSSFPPFASYVHQTPGDLPVVYVNHGMTLVGSGQSFEFSWELQNRANITVPPGFELMLFKGGYDSVASRLLSEPTSYVRYGAPFPYHYNPDTWCYYNQSIIRLFDHARSEYAGFVCFNKAEIGPLGTIVILKNATICTYSSLSVEGTELVIEGSVTFCDLTLATDFVVNPGQSLIISCSLTWLTGTVSGRGSVEILPGAYLYIHPKDPEDDDFYHHEVHEFISILNDGYSEVTTSLTGFQSANFTNLGQLDMIEGHWVKQIDNTESVAVLYNSGEVNVLTKDIIFEWNITQFAGVFNLRSQQFLHTETAWFRGGNYHQHQNTQFKVTKDLIFDDCDAIFDSSHLIPLENSAIMFMSSSSVSWNNVPFTFNCDTCDLTFASNTVISRSPNTFTFRSGLLTFLDVSTEFIIDKFIQAGGTLVSNPASDVALLDDYELHNGLVITNSDWTAKEVEWRAGTFTGPQTFTANEIEILTNAVKVCDADLVFYDALFSRGTTSGTAACTITTTTFLSKSSPVTVSLTGCSSTFIIEGVLTVETGTLSFRMGYLVNGLVDVISRMAFTSCETVVSSRINIKSNSQMEVNGFVFFNELSQLTGEKGGTLTINHDAVVSGIVNFEGCVHVSAGVELSFVSAQVDLINICTNRGDVTFIDSVVDSINVLKLLNGRISFNTITLVSSFVLEEQEGGTLTFNTVTVDSFDVLSISGGLIDFAPTSSVIVHSIVQSNGLISVNSLNTLFNRSNFTSTGGVLQTFDGFNVSRSVFVLDGGDVIIDQFDPHFVNIESLIINSGSFITIVDQMFNSSHVLMADGYLGGISMFIDILDVTGGTLYKQSTSIVNSLTFFEDGPKNFDEGALVTSLIHTTWFDGSVVGTNYSRLVIPVDTNLNLFGTEGWFVPEEVDINSAIHSEGHLIFSTPETITMQWDIYGPRISVLTGTVIFEDNLVLVDDVYLAPNTIIYIKGEFNVSDSIAGGGDIYIDDPDSLVTFNGLVNLTGVLYMRDGLLDLRLSNPEDITYVYTGGIILFREEITDTIIRLQEVRIDLDISGSDLELVHIGICDAPITVKETTIARFIVDEMTENCVLSLLNDTIVAELEIDQMNGGELTFGTDSDVKLVSITLIDGLITAEPNSSPSFSGGDLLVNGGAIVFKENASVSFVNVKTVMASGSFTISTQGTDGCPHWEELSLSNDAQVFIGEPHCVSSADLVEMQDESQLTATGDLYIDDFSLIGGSIGGGSSIHVIDNFSATTDQPKNFEPGSVVFINSTSDFTLSQGYEDQVTTFGDGAVVYVAPEGSLLISSKDTTFHYATDCDSCKIPTGFVSEGSVIISTPIKSVFGTDIVSTGHLAFENSTISDLNGRVTIDGSTFIRDQAVVTFTGSIHQGSLYVSSGVSLLFESAYITRLNICQSLGNISVSNSIVSSVLISEFSGGSVTFDQITVVEVLEFNQHSNGQLIIGDVIIRSLIVQNSDINIMNSNILTFVSTVSLLNSTLDFSFNNAIVTNSISICKESSISIEVFIDLSFLTSRLSISPSSHCCNTSICQLSLHFDDVYKLESYLIMTSNKSNLDVVFEQDFLHLNLNNVVSLDSSLNHVFVRFYLEELEYHDQLFIPICPIDFSSFEPPTIGGSTILYAFNLGLAPLIIFSDTLVFNQSLLTTPLTHVEVVLNPGPGHGCHYLTLSRSTDTSQSTFHFCFKKPIIYSITPTAFYLTGNLVITGSNLYTSFDFFSLSNAFNLTKVLYHSHDEIRVHIPYVCSVDSIVFDVFLVIGNQTSNQLPLYLLFPQFDTSPLMLSSFGSELRLIGDHLGSMFDCFDHVDIFVSESPANFTILNETVVVIKTGPVFGFFDFSANIQFPPMLLHSLSVPVTSLEVFKVSYVCFVNSPCEVFVSYEADEGDLSSFQLSSNIPSYIEILDYTSSLTTFRLYFISSKVGYLDQPELCNRHGCFAISKLPFIVEPMSISPKYIQWFDQPVTSTISLQITNIHTYSYSRLVNSFCFPNTTSVVDDIGQDFITFSVFFPNVGNYSVFGITTSGLLDLDFTCFVDNFVQIPPFIPQFSRVEVILLKNVQNLLLIHGSQFIPLQEGINEVQILHLYPLVTLKNEDHVMNVSFVEDFVENQIPLYFQSNLVHSLFVDFYSPQYLISISSIGHCELLEQNSISGILEFTIFAHSEAECFFLFDVSYFDSSLSFDIHRSFVHHPVFSINSPLVFSTVNDVIVDVTILSPSPLNSDFLLNNSHVYPSFEDFSYNDFASLPYQYNNVFNLSFVLFPFGENLLSLTWKHEGFSDIEIALIRIFNVDFSSVNPLSVYEARDIRVDFLGLLVSDLFCIIQGQSFDVVFTNHSFVCKNSILITFEPFVTIFVYYNDLFINSFVVRGEAFIQEICYLLMSTTPLIDTSIITSNIDKNLIFDGSRCCHLEASFCSEFISSFSNPRFDFEFPVDILKVIITTNDSCHLEFIELEFDIVLLQ